MKTLRQAALEVTARHCSRELDQYGQCVAAKPESWQRDCHHLKMSIARCTSSHPIIRRIRQACAEPFEAFEECLRQNEAATNNCVEQRRRCAFCIRCWFLVPVQWLAHSKFSVHSRAAGDSPLCPMFT
ncbi:coiled-coil-helix-coiled-coil-helix domain-containing protein 5 isoform X3 [Pteropus vampyrus]|uniref:Coiled-coil-helix-coiled-coil-helix domain-containing protein 5 isoform X3 n=1 Tax=Pteropus vampyrus TaxID=132908 RepID=A0A6P6BRJ9_PTEVA|nr:coiled-coil-helix-coiled-coil-helix domain-containing protein 5 isoform X3 [Pteropus vampyrus]